MNSVTHDYDSILVGSFVIGKMSGCLSCIFDSLIFFRVFDVMIRGFITLGIVLKEVLIKFMLLSVKCRLSMSM